MALFEKINEDIKAAMKAREKDKLEALRNIKKMLLEARSAKGAGSEINDLEVLKIISKLAKQGNDSANIYKQQNRDDLYQQEMVQVAVFESYLPAKISDEQLSQAIQEIITETGATSIKDMGKIMGIATKKLAGKADGKEISEKVRSLLQ